MSVCPYCDSDTWRNCWGKGDAKCVECGEEFNVVWSKTEDGSLVLTGRKVMGVWKEERIVNGCSGTALVWEPIPQNESEEQP